jgi:hypothetical protein
MFLPPFTTEDGRSWLALLDGGFKVVAVSSLRSVVQIHSEVQEDVYES